MIVGRLLNSIGKATFIKYYHSFRDKSRDYCISNFDEDYTDKAKSSKTGHAQKIFHDGFEKEVDCQQYLRQFFLGHYHNIFIGYRS